MKTLKMANKIFVFKDKYITYISLRLIINVNFIFMNLLNIIFLVIANA